MADPVLQVARPIPQAGDKAVTEKARARQPRATVAARIE